MIYTGDYRFVTNYNTGIKYEIAVAMCLISNVNIKSFIKLIKDRKDFNSIMDSYNKYMKCNLLGIIKEYYGLDIKEVCIVTQDDSCGPSDLIINQSTNAKGISLKYNTKVDFNPTGRDFLSIESISNIQDLLPIIVQKYIIEQNEKQPFSKWFRNRKNKSIVLNDFIQYIKKLVCNDYELKSDIEKKQIENKISHKNTNIEYITLYIKETKKSVKFEIKSNDISTTYTGLKLINEIHTNYILFECNGIVVGRMQVKFNNGILEKETRSTKTDIEIDSLKIKFGNPLTSWNYSI